MAVSVQEWKECVTFLLNLIKLNSKDERIRMSMELTKFIPVSFLLTFLVANFPLKKPNVEQLDQPVQTVQQVLLVD